MARTAILPGLTWQDAIISQVRRESATGTTLRLDVANWPGHRAGQHVDIRLTSSDGYTAVRPYSLASPGGSDSIEITVEVTRDGEVSPYLAQSAQNGHHVEVRGPLGNWFVWEVSNLAPVQLVAGGSGVVPLMSMLRTHHAAGHPAPMRLLYSVADSEHVLYRDELEQFADRGVVAYIYTRDAPPGVSRPPGRVTDADLTDYTLSAETRPSCYVCGPTGFVESVQDRLVSLGYDPDRIRAERYGEGSTS
jgi:ferredoxin-NADP reductase